MATPDFRGARGSNAGDDFHELWALRQALTLLDNDTSLSGMTLEGLSDEDEAGSSKATWDGVDCALYFGGDNALTADEIHLVQFKYSSASPTSRWTVARLTRNTTRNSNNSVIRQLGFAFEGMRKVRRKAKGIQ